MLGLPREQLLAEMEDVIRAMPPRDGIWGEDDGTLSWFGRAQAAMHMWDGPRAVLFDGHVRAVHTGRAPEAERGLKGMIAMLHQARHELRLSTVGPLTVALEKGGVFDYFDEVRKVIEAAKADLLFVDPYLDAEFVSRYLPHVTTGVSVRLLGNKKQLPTLGPAVELLRQQTGLSIEIRTASGMHDRYVFVDRKDCYQSGASFKDGAKKAPTTLTQIVDAFNAVFGTYEQAWASATPHP